ncbi:hypothetical protein AAF712_011538 [Marasmius tenuissimus]|uniref:Uncharacterized protein n=1 Tax=Marasmius tenuissimus TaxID=585030 RepID=A0ABR2ZKU0_9AGAR
MPASFFGGPGMTIQGNLRLLRYEDGSEILVSGDSVVDGDEPMEDIRIFGRNHVVNTGNGYYFSRAEDADSDSESSLMTFVPSPDDGGNPARRGLERRSFINGDLHITTAGYGDHRSNVSPQGSQGGGPNRLSSAFRASDQRDDLQPTPNSYSMSHPPSNYGPPGFTQLGGSSNPFRQAIPRQTPIPQQMGQNYRYPIPPQPNHPGYSGQAPAHISAASIVEITPEGDKAEGKSEEPEQSDDEGKGEGAPSSTNSVPDSAAYTAH